MTREYLTQNFVNGDNRIQVTVAREVAEDDLRIEEIEEEQFADWMEANVDRILKSALHKKEHGKHEHVKGTIFIKPGELLD